MEKAIHKPEEKRTFASLFFELGLRFKNVLVFSERADDNELYYVFGHWPGTSSANDIPKYFSELLNMNPKLRSAFVENSTPRDSKLFRINANTLKELLLRHGYSYKTVSDKEAKLAETRYILGMRTLQADPTKQMKASYRSRLGSLIGSKDE